MKTCTKCKLDKDLDEFFLRGDGSKSTRRSHCKVCVSLYDGLNKKKRAKYQKQYRKDNKQALAKRETTYKYNKRKADINYRLASNLRSRLSSAVKNDRKSSSAVSDLGCTIEEFKSYLESKFLPGMTWDNYGKWHIDHIKPLAKFDLTIAEEQKKACHYSNLQPLWALDNIIKSDNF